MSRQDYSRVTSQALGLLIFLHIVLIFSPWRFTMPQDGLDPSWVAVLTHGAGQGWQWGKDIVFNYGPSGFLWNRLFDEQVMVATMTLQFLLAGSLAWGVSCLLFTLPPLVALVAYPPVVLGIVMSRDCFFFVLPLLVALGHFRRPNPVSIIALLPVVVAAGAASTVKLTYGVAGLMILGIVDMHRLSGRHWPIYTPVLLLAFFTFHFINGQNLAAFPDFLRLSLEIIAGHSSAMAAAGSWWELLVFIGLSVMAILLLIWNVWQQKRIQTWMGYGHWLALLLVLSGFWFINFKQGFVRHDLHSVAAWGSLAVVSAVVAATVLWQPPARRGLFAGMLAVAIIAAFTGLWRWQLGGGPTVTTLIQMVFHHQPAREWQNIRDWFKSPADWKARLNQQRDNALARIRDQYPLPPLRGSVDVIPSIQSVILAHGYDYRPRPVFQEYVAYTPKLIATNQAFLKSERAPDYLFFSPGSIDDRYPSSAEGAAWPDILRYYRFERMVNGDLALLTRRTEPLTGLLDGGTTRTFQFGEPLALAEQPTVFARIRIETTGLGKLANFLFKPAPVFLSVKLHDGTLKTHRLIPEMASEGFLLSPYIKDSAGFSQLATGKTESLLMQQVDEITITTGGYGQFYYQKLISMDWQSLQTKKLLVD